MRGRLLLLALLSITGAVGLVASGTVKLPHLPWNMASLAPLDSAPKPPRIEIQEGGKSDAQKTLEDTTAALGIDTQGQAGADKPVTEPVLDISRISPDGPSVFAGRAAPNSYVTVLEDGKPAGTAKADENGSWSLSTEHKFASLDPKLTFRADANPPPAPASAQTASIAPPPSSKAASPTAEVMRKFENLVAEAREHAKSAEAKPSKTAQAEPKSPSAEPAAPSAPLPEKTIGASATTGPELGSRDAPIPVPIMFVYNEAELTSEGHRAVTLLLEYVKLERLPSIELSGHADERGTDDYNMDLSRERLETVARILRDGGYDGQLQLKPKGKSEPFTGVDRSKYTQEALYQLDRRVELHIVR